MSPTFFRQVEHLLLNLTGGLGSSSGFGAEEATTGVSTSGVPGLGFGDSSQGFKNKDGGNGDDDGGVGGDGEGEEEEEGLRISASSLSRLHLS